MDANVMELRLKQWLPIFEEQAKSGLNKQDWCARNGIKRGEFFKWQRECRAYLLNKKSSIPATTETSFVEICCSHESAEIIDNLSNPVETLNKSSISITKNGFTITLNDVIDESNLSKVLRAVCNAD